MGYKDYKIQKMKEISKMRLELPAMQALKAQMKPDPETQERREIYQIIHRCVLLGMGEEEILKILNKKHNNPKLMPYYEGYIKHEKSKQQKSRDDDEGR